MYYLKMSEESASAPLSETRCPKRRRPEESETVCPICKEEVSSDGVDCQWCKNWEHYTCAAFSKEEYDLLSLNNSRIMFFCCECQLKVNKAIEFFDNMVNRQNLIDRKLQCIERKLDTLSRSVGSAQNDDVMLCDPAESSDSGPARPNEILPRPDSLTCQGISSAVASVIAEEKDKDKRKLNVILHNVDEPKAEDGLARKKTDMDVAVKIFQKNLGVSVKVTNAVRLGKKSNKPCLLKISVDSEQSKAAVLQNCTKLRGKEVPQHLTKVFITPDMTPKERERTTMH